MNFLNSGVGYKLFKEATLLDTYVDKTMRIDTLSRHVISAGKYICVTRPRRFGKSVAANMIAAFFDKSTKEESRTLFENFRVGSLKAEQEKNWSAFAQGTEAKKLCWPLQGNLNVIRINMIDVLGNDVHSDADFYALLDYLLRLDLQKVYPEMNFSSRLSIPA